MKRRFFLLLLSVLLIANLFPTKNHVYASSNQSNDEYEVHQSVIMHNFVVGNRFTEGVRGVGSAIGGAVSGAWDVTKSAGSKVISGIKKTGASMWETVSGTPISDDRVKEKFVQDRNREKRLRIKENLTQQDNLKGQSGELRDIDKQILKRVQNHYVSLQNLLTNIILIMASISMFVLVSAIFVGAIGLVTATSTILREQVKRQLMSVVVLLLILSSSKIILNLIFSILWAG